MRFVADKKPFKLKGKSFGEVEVSTEYPQFDNVNEMIQSAGDENGLIEWANKMVKSHSVVGLRNLNVKHTTEDDTTTAEVAVAKAIEIRKNYSLKSSRSGMTKNEKAERFDDVMSNVNSLDENASIDDIRKKIAELKASLAA